MDFDILVQIKHSSLEIAGMGTKKLDSLLAISECTICLNTTPCYYINRTAGRAYEKKLIDCYKSEIRKRALTKHSLIAISIKVKEVLYDSFFPVCLVSSVC